VTVSVLISILIEFSTFRAQYPYFREDHFSVKIPGQVSVEINIQSMQWMSDATVGGDDDTPNSACNSIEDRLTKLAFGRELN
jgi:hypothetical protein